MRKWFNRWITPFLSRWVLLQLVFFFLLITFINCHYYLYWRSLWFFSAIHGNVDTRFLVQWQNWADHETDLEVGDEVTRRRRCSHPWPQTSNTPASNLQCDSFNCNFLEEAPKRRNNSPVVLVWLLSPKGVSLVFTENISQRPIQHGQHQMNMSTRSAALKQ